MIIDIHNHPYWYGYDEKNFIANMDEYGIDKTCLLSWETPVEEYDPQYNDKVPEPGTTDGPVSFRLCVKMCRAQPDRFILGFGPDPRRADAISRLLWAKETFGIKLCGEIKLRMAYDNPDAIRLYRVCGKEKLPVLLHLEDPWETNFYYRKDYWYGGSIGALERAIRLCPDTAFIGHAPGFWAYISGDEETKDGIISPYAKTPVIPNGRLIRMLDEYPNLFCDISAGSGRLALERDPVFAREFLEKYSDRILFGRDCFDNGHRELLDNLGLTKTTLEKLYYKNASKLLGLEK